MGVLHCLWVAYCLHHDLDADTATYDYDILHLWESLAEIGFSMPFTEFDNAVAGSLLSGHKGKRRKRNGRKKEKIFDGKDTFEVVDFVPLGYRIWNIGKCMMDGYLPFCRLKAQQPFPGAREIEPDTLKAIKTKGAQIILAAAESGHDTIEKMESYIQEHQNASPGTWEYTMVQRMQEALPYMRQLKLY